MRRALICLVLVALGAAGLWRTRPAHAAEEAWEKAVRAEIAEEDRLLDHARRRGTTRQVVSKYASRLGRQPSALNHFLLGRALYYDGDKAGAERHLKEALRLEPRYWFAKLRLALLELERSNKTIAEQYLRDVLRVKPREADALKIWSQLLMEKKDWDGAIRAMEVLRAQDPANDQIRYNITFALMAKGDWASALAELKVLKGRNPKDPSIQAYYARALFETGSLSEASRVLEGLVRINPKDVRFLDILKVIYAQLKDWKSLEKTFERMLPLLPEGQDKEQMAAMLKQLKEGRIPQDAPAQGEWKQDPFVVLLEQATNPSDVEARREALQQYFAAEIPMMPSALVLRVHPETEEDPVCRQWLFRIMGGLQNAALAQIAAYGLFDPEPSVRVTAAEALGDIATPSGLLYLIPFFIGPTIPAQPTTDQVQEMNAARIALMNVTGHQDIFGTAEVWIDAKKLAPMVDDWRVWLRTKEGVMARLRAIKDLEAQNERRPHLYVIEDITDAQESPEISFAAYKVLRARSKKESEEAVAKAMWPRFPRYEDAQLTPANLERIRKEVNAWWNAWLRMRRGG